MAAPEHITVYSGKRTCAITTGTVLLAFFDTTQDLQIVSVETSIEGYGGWVEYGYGDVADDEGAAAKITHNVSDSGDPLNLVGRYGASGADITVTNDDDVHNGKRVAVDGALLDPLDHIKKVIDAGRAFYVKVTPDVATPCAATIICRPLGADL